MALRDQRPSEFGGRPGLVQRQSDGHELDETERQRILRSVDPSPIFNGTELIIEELPEGFDPGTRLV